MAYPRLHYTLFLLLIGCFLQITFTSAWTGTMQSRSRLVTLLGHRRPQLFSRSVHTRAHDNANDDVDQQHDHDRPPQLQNIAIVGGGLAGLSTAYHLLEKTQARNNSRCRVTIFDTAPVGTAGASSVAGGYVLYLLLLGFGSIVIFRHYIHSFYSSRIIDIFATLD
jgi:hypothetical protein